MKSTSGNYQLDSSLYDFQDVKEGDYLGELDGNKLFAKQSGKIVFVKHYSQTSGLALPGIEVFRYLRPVGYEELAPLCKH